MTWRTLTDARFLMWFVVAGGLALRVWHYAANHTIWYDESVLLANVMEKDFAQLAGPLHHEVAAPPLFVWLLKLIHLSGGDEPYLWRLPPFLFSVAGLLVTVPLARRLFPPHLAVLAVALVAVSDNHIWLGCCVKPYISDALVTTALLLHLLGTTHWPISRRLLVLAAATPVLFGFSYTATLGVGAVLLALAPAAGRGGTRGRITWVVAITVVAATAAVLYFGPVKAQRVPRLVEEWTERGYFPNYAEPLSLPWWVLKNVLGVCQYVCHPSGFVLGLLAPLGAWALWKAGKREVVIACVGLFVLALVAAAVKAYPLGQIRLSHFLAPAVLVLGVAGVQQLARWWGWIGMQLAWLLGLAQAVLWRVWRALVRAAREPNSAQSYRTPENHSQLPRLGRWWEWLGVGLVLLLVAVADSVSLFHLYQPWSQPDAQAVKRYVMTHRQPGEAILSDEGNYIYFFHGEVKPIAAGGAEVPAGGRAWVVMDFYDDEQRRAYIDARLAPLGFECVESHSFREAGAYLYERK